MRSRAATAPTGAHAATSLAAALPHARSKVAACSKVALRTEDGESSASHLTPSAQPTEPRISLLLSGVSRGTASSQGGLPSGDGTLARKGGATSLADGNTPIVDDLTVLNAHLQA